MAKRLTDEEKKEWIERVVESGRANQAVFLSELLKRFPDCPASITDWIKKFSGESASVYLTKMKAIMNDEERLAFMWSIMEKLENRYVGKEAAPDYETLKADNPDINFYYIHLLAEQTTDKQSAGDHNNDAYYTFLAEHGCLKTQKQISSESGSVVENRASETKAYTVADDHSSKQWYLSSVPMKASLEVQLSDGKRYKYRARRRVGIGDPVVIGRGAKTTGEMGTVTKIMDLSATKKSHTAEAMYSFCQTPSNEEIQKCADAIIDMGTFEKVSKKFTFSPGNFAYVDSMVEVLLNAASVLAYPEFATSTAKKKAIECLQTEKTVPGFLYGEGMQNPQYYYRGTLTDNNFKLFYIDYPEVIFSGYYPGWDKKLFALSVWKKLKAAGSKIQKKMDKAEIACINIHFYDEGTPNFAVGKIEGHCIIGCEHAELEKIIDDDSEYHKACNELIFRSALSILIQGDFANLLDAFLSAKPPVGEFADSLAAYAQELGSSECAAVLDKYF